MHGKMAIIQYRHRMQVIDDDDDDDYVIDFMFHNNQLA